MPFNFKPAMAQIAKATRAVWIHLCFWGTVILLNWSIISAPPKKPEGREEEPRGPYDIPRPGAYSGAPVGALGGASVGGIARYSAPPPTPPAMLDPYSGNGPPIDPYRSPFDASSPIDVSKSTAAIPHPLDAGLPVGTAALVQIESRIQLSNLLSDEQKKALIGKVKNLSVRELYHLVEQLDLETDKHLRASQQFQSFVEKLGTPSSEAAMQKISLPVAEPVAGNPGFVLDPYTRKPLDARGHGAGAVMMDPETGKRFRLP